MCFVNSMFLLPQKCQRLGSRFLGSVVRWVAEIILRVVGFIEAFVQSFISAPNTCVGPNCDQKAGSKEQSAKGVNAKPLGNMLVILLSIPIDILIGDADVSCTQICPSILARPKPDACGCWNRSPAYAGGANNALTGPYFPLTSNYSACVDQLTFKHVGQDFGNTGACCVITNPDLAMTLKSPLPVCQSPDDIAVVIPTVNVTFNQLYNITTNIQNYNYSGTNISYTTPSYPGSCVALGACRADALPSCANDPETPIGLSAQFAGALDGLVMGFLKYLRCLLSNLLGCDGAGNNCTPLGIIFYPAILIFSISWQILGGVIRFIASILIFVLSLFTPPSGAACTCWNAPQKDGFNATAQRYWYQVAGLCYKCTTLGHDCNVYPPVGTFVNDYCAAWLYPCAKWCPYQQQLANPGFTQAQSLAACIAAYPNFTHINNDLTAYEACTGYPISLQACDIFSSDPARQSVCVNFFDPTVAAFSMGNTPVDQSITTKQGDVLPNTGTGLCLNYRPRSATNDPSLLFSTPPTDFKVLDACPNPHCQHNAPFHPNQFCGQSVKGFWPCSGAIGQPAEQFANYYPGDPLVTCGALQLLSNFLDIWTAFAAIFTTPLLISANTNGARSIPSIGSAFSLFQKPERGRFVGPVVRETRQRFNKRFEGTVYGLDNSGGTNMIEALAEAVYNYDSSDCYSDPMACACRNFDISAHCYIDANGQVAFGHAGRKRDGTNMTINDLNMMLHQEMFTGNSVCDHTIDQICQCDWHTNVTEDRKNRYVSCLDKKIQGSRLQQIADVFPDDIMYNSQAPLTLMQNVFHTVRQGVSKRAATRQQDSNTAREEMEIRFPRFNEQLTKRMELAHEILEADYGITPSSMIYDAAIKADQVWFKYQTGFYNFALEKTYEGIASGKAILPSTQEALADVGHAARDLKNILLSQRYTHLYESTKEAVHVATRHLNELVDTGIMESIKSAYTRHIEYRKKRVGRVSDEKAEFAKRSFFASPLVQWYYATPRESRIFTPFIDHMYRVVDFQRKHWQNSTLNAFNADLKFWSLKDIFTTRWSKGPQWTPEKLANVERAKRVYYQVQERIWPGSTPAHLKERFLFLNNCVIVDKALNITLKVIDYCANEAMPNLNFTKKRADGTLVGGEYFIPPLRAG